MDQSLSLVYSDKPSAHEVEMVKEGIIEEAVNVNMGRMTPYAFFLKDAQSKVVGGAVGYTMYGQLYTDMLWIDRAFRNKGLGSKLLIAAEELGKKRKCTFSCLLTMSWQALPMYQKLGYEIEFVREGFENSAKMYHLRKSLV